MDWIIVLQDIICNSISDIIVAAICGLVGWIIYSVGIKGKEKNQIASERKKTIYIPLKYELESITNIKDDIWKYLRVNEVRKIVEKNDEFVVNKKILKKCKKLLNMIDKYNSINLYSLAGKIISKHFEKKYIELYGSSTHLELYWDDIMQEETELEHLDQEIIDFQRVIGIKENIDVLFKYSPEYEEAYNEIGRVGPIEDHLIQLFASVLTKNENQYDGIKMDSINCDLLDNKKITPAKYIANGFNFFEEFEKDESVKKKKELLVNIRECSSNISKDVIAKIRFIGKKYEKE